MGVIYKNYVQPGENLICPRDMENRMEALGDKDLHWSFPVWGFFPFNMTTKGSVYAGHQEKYFLWRLAYESVWHHTFLTSMLITYVQGRYIDGDLETRLPMYISLLTVGCSERQSVPSPHRLELFNYMGTANHQRAFIDLRSFCLSKAS